MHKAINVKETESFRDHLGIITDDGKRKVVYPKKPSGRFYKARTYFSLFLLAFMIIMPFIKVNGHPFMMINILERKFILFGMPFGTGDFFILAIGFIALIVGIILFTAIFGRVFCGWACPQTVFLEMVFRKIEYLFEGDYFKQKQFNLAPWNFNKLIRKISKWTVFFILSVIISNIFIAWVIGIDKLWQIISEPVSQHMWGFIAMLIFAIVFYFVFAWFREYACIYVCPYGRLQGVLLDNNSLVIAYDYVRGEPRAKLTKSAVRTEGDCIDCKECTAVCPTAIDIRNGTQLECVNCTACIDACDNIMDKIGKPRGLIRFASENNIKNKTKFRFTGRMYAYTAILLVLISVFTVLIINRKPVEVKLLRAPGMLFQQQPDNKISNLYSLKLINKTFNNIDISLKLENIKGQIQIIGGSAAAISNDVTEIKFLILIDRNELHSTNVPVEIGIYYNNQKFETKKINFLAPPNDEIK